MRNLLVLMCLTVCFSLQGFGKSKKESPLMGESTLNIFIGKKLFPDKVVLKKDKKGKYFGTLTVPKAFTAKLEKIKIGAKDFSFEIEADEGRGKFRVRYQGEIHPTGKVYTGIATLVPGGKLLGGFVGQTQKSFKK